MECTLGQKIAELRRTANITQEILAEKMGVSPQAVSKWENDQSCPDIMLLRDLAGTLGVTVDELLSPQKLDRAVLLPQEQRKKADDMLLRIVIYSSKGDSLKINLPFLLITSLVEAGVDLSGLTDKGKALKNIDWNEILHLVEAGVAGQLLEIQDADGDHISISVQ